MSEQFITLGISLNLAALLDQNGITQPTPVQEQVIPVLMEGRDVIAQAQTGTGKTLAFILPILERIQPDQACVQALIITPTRELALQITSEAKKYAAEKGVNILSAYGGQDVDQQIRKLKGDIHVVIGTPGRLLDHIGRKTVRFEKTSMLVLDEADQMLDMGFLKDVEQIMETTAEQRQTMLFSATMPGEIHKLASRYMQQPAHVKIQGKNITLDEIEQLVIETTDRGKQEALCKMIQETNPFLAIIFCRTKRRVTALYYALKSRGYKVDELHGDLTQAKREQVMKIFRKAELQLLVATDVAARGLDVEGVTHVFNYDIPQDAESYIHRIGRTGRAGEKGKAVTFVAHKDRGALHLIEKALKTYLPKKKMGPFEQRRHEERKENAQVSQSKSGYRQDSKMARRPGGRSNSAKAGFAKKRNWKKPS